MPDALIAQLKEGGCLVIPVGERQQQLLMIEKWQGRIRREVLESVRFVPLVSGEVM